jgi:hypothetical protein
MGLLVASLDLERFMREALAAHIDSYVGGILRDESRALFERYEPRLLEYLDDRVVRHRQRPRH